MTMQPERETERRGANAIVVLRPGPKCRLEEDFDNTLHVISELAKIRCTQKEICAVLKVSEGTLSRFMDRWPEAREALEWGYEHFTMSLRRSQYISAVVRGNPQMQIWLGKQHLGQRDKMDIAANLNAPPHEDELDQLE